MQKKIHLEHKMLQQYIITLLYYEVMVNILLTFVFINCLLGVKSLRWYFFFPPSREMTSKAVASLTLLSLPGIKLLGSPHLRFGDFYLERFSGEAADVLIVLIQR